MEVAAGQDRQTKTTQHTLPVRCTDALFGTDTVSPSDLTPAIDISTLVTAVCEPSALLLHDFISAIYWLLKLLPIFIATSIAGSLRESAARLALSTIRPRTWRIFSRSHPPVSHNHTYWGAYRPCLPEHVLLVLAMGHKFLTAFRSASCFKGGR